MQWKYKMEARAMLQFAFYPDFPRMHFNDLAHNGEAQPGSLNVLSRG